MTVKLREDIFISVCCVLSDIDTLNLAEFKKLAASISGRFKYWEILIGVPSDIKWDSTALLSAVANLRILSIRSATSFYRARLAVASDAIGDVVLLTSAEELSVFDPVKMIEQSNANDAIVIGRRQRSGFANPFLVAFGRSAGFRVDERDMLTAAYPRTLLNRILAYTDAQLALRFPPQDNSLPVEWIIQSEKSNREQPFREIGRRFGLIHRLMINSAPRVLTSVSLLSLVVMCIGILFAAYAALSWLTIDDIQPGWLTTSLALSMTATFLSCAIFGLSIGLQRVIELITQKDISDDVTAEKSTVDMFGQVFHLLNVDIEEQNAQTPLKPADQPHQ